MANDGLTVRDVASATGLDFERLLSGFDGTQCFSLIEIERICISLNVEVAEQIGMVVY